MSSGCMSSTGCVDARAPVRATYVNLYKWPESDAEFVKTVAKGGGGEGGGGGRRKWGPSPAVVDSYSCRQMYLRSYTFSKKESVPEKTRRCLGKVKERAGELQLFHQRRESSGSVGSVSGDEKGKRRLRRRESSGSIGSVSGDEEGKRKQRKKKKKKKGCVMVRKLKEISCSAFYSIFHRLLSCTTSVEVV